MEGKSQKKVMAAGFKIIRTDDQPSIRIKFKEDGSYEWHTLKTFETKASRERYFVKLLEDDNIIAD